MNRRNSSKSSDKPKSHKAIFSAHEKKVISHDQEPEKRRRSARLLNMRNYQVDDSSLCPNSGTQSISYDLQMEDIVAQRSNNADAARHSRHNLRTQASTSSSSSPVDSSYSGSERYYEHLPQLKVRRTYDTGNAIPNNSNIGTRRRRGLENRTNSSRMDPPLSSTINLIDDEENDEVTFTNISNLSGRPSRKKHLLNLDSYANDKFSQAVIEEDPEFLKFTLTQKAKINDATIGSHSEEIISKFNISITRDDIHTLLEFRFLNDEVINFYMNLLTERGERKSGIHGLPRVYAMNTFFMTQLLADGYSRVKRWTTKIDIFSKDIILVPVHVRSYHWCMAIIHLKNRTIKYYDSMGACNPKVLDALKKYLREESLDKRKVPFDTNSFEVESVRNLPHQTNTYDGGVFSCMFAEYVTRNMPINFSQDNMCYFREKMILEIAQGELLH